jgi:L-cysteine S-thiosulfotransferase
MSRTLAASAMLIPVLAIAACMAGPKSPSGFHLPDGNPQKGRAVFAELRCHQCHQVATVGFPAPVAEPPVPVVLGGKVVRLPTDGELVTAVIDPSHHIALHSRGDVVQVGTRSRMGELREAMTVDQLVDLVAFLHSLYELEPQLPAGP